MLMNRLNVPLLPSLVRMPSPLILHSHRTTVPASPAPRIKFPLPLCGSNRVLALRSVITSCVTSIRLLSAMRICLLQSSYDGSSNPLEVVDQSYPDPAMFTSQHEFHHRHIYKATADAQIDAAVAEGFDMFFNFMWGQHEDTVAGVDAIRHLESLGVPFIGFTSKTLVRSKLEFYAAATKAGLPIPASGSDVNFPVFVKPAKMCASMFIDENSVCRNEDELDRQLKRINEYLSSGRKVAAARETDPNCNPTTQGHSNGHSNATGTVKYVNDHDDIVVQEYIPGRDYSVVVIEMGNTPVAQNPTKYHFPAEKAAAGMDYMAFDVKFHKELREELVVRSEDPALFDMLRDLAEKAWHVNGMHGSSWCNVDIRVRHGDGKPFILELNPMPTVFYRWEHEWEDVVIRETFPGGHRALVNALITTKLLQIGTYKAAVNAIGENFDSVCGVYETWNTPMNLRYESLVAEFDFSGTVFDLGSGTGIFGRYLHEYQKKEGRKLSTVVGNDISPGMVRNNPLPEAYKEVIIGPLQEAIMDTTERFDHITCLTALQYLDEVMLYAVLARMFQLAQKSVTITVDEIPDSYNAGLAERGLASMRANNHLQVVEGFGVPRGWRVAYRQRAYGWASPRTGDEVFVTIFRFEALKALSS